MTADDALGLLDDLDNGDVQLTDWEADFLDSVMRQCELGYDPTGRQAMILQKLWDDKIGA